MNSDITLSCGNGVEEMNDTCEDEVSYASTYDNVENNSKLPAMNCDDYYDENAVNEDLYYDDEENYDDNENYEDYYADDEYYMDYDEPYNYGDGVDAETFKNIQAIILDLIAATARLGGRIKKDAENYLVSVLAVCSLEERKALMKVQNWKHIPLSLACEIGNLNLVKFLVEDCGADVNEFFGWSLYWAIITRRKNIVQYLVDKNADVGMCIIDNCNILMIALGIEFGLASIRNDETRSNQINRHQIINDNTRKLFSLLRDEDILNMVIEKGAVEKCSKQLLFDILKVCLTKGKEYFLPKLLDRITAIDDVKDSNGCTILEYNVLRANLDGITTLTERGANINDMKSFQVISVPTMESKCEKIQDNIDAILDSCFSHENAQKTDQGSRHFVHPVVYAAHLGHAKLLYHLLAMPQIPLKDKLDAVEITGAFLVVKRQKYKEALLCWNTAMDMRFKKDAVFTYDLENPVNATVDTMKQIDVTKVLNLVTEGYIGSKEKEILPKTIVPLRRRAFNFQLEFSSKTELDGLIPEMAAEILNQACLLYERLVGYGKHFTLNACAVLAQKYMQFRNMKSFVYLVTYSLPYCIAHVKRTPENAVRLMMGGLSRIMAKKTLRSQLDFDTLMTILKCIFFVCFKSRSSTQVIKREQFMFLLLNVLKINEHEKTQIELLEFRAFLKFVVKSDLRDSFNQTLLHYSVLTRKMQSDSEDERDYDDSFNLVGGNWWMKCFEDPVVLTNLLLESGANPDALDQQGQSPLHTFYIGFRKKLKHNYKVVLEALVDAGAHKDCPDVDGKTPIDYSVGTSLPLCPVGDCSLQCLASCVILQNNIQYKDQLTLYLSQFVEMHKRHGLAVVKNVYNLSQKYMYSLI